MNNKLFARILTAVICICMMSTVVFAADPTLSVEEDTATLSFAVGTDGADITVSEEDQITMIAYLVDASVETPANIPDYTNQAVVAINQVDGADGFGDVLIAASKLEEGKKIAVVLGGSDGTTEKYLVAQEVIADEVKVTVMNGADAIEITADADGNVTLPADTVFNKTVANAKYTFTIYSWVTVDGATEYLAGTEVDAATLEGVTLYAKYLTNIVIGDTNGNGSIQGTDRTYLHQYISTMSSANPTKRGDMGKTFAELTGIADLAGVVGDTNGNGSIQGTDRTYLHQYISTMTTANPTKRGNMGKPVYYVNK